MKHQGNVAMRKLVKERLQRWESAAFKDKSGISWEVVNEIVRGGGRFLKEAPEGWFVEVDPEAVKQKVSIAFRDMAKRKKRQICLEEEAQQWQQQQQQQQQQSQVFAQLDFKVPFPLLTNPSPSADSVEFLNMTGYVPQKRRRLSDREGGCAHGNIFCNFS